MLYGTLATGSNALVVLECIAEGERTKQKRKKISKNENVHDEDDQIMGVY